MLLSEAELRAALEPVLDRVLADRLRLFQLQSEPRLQALLRDALRSGPAQIPVASLDRLLQAASPNAAFQTYFASARDLIGPALALLVIHRGLATPWKALGMSGLPHAPALTGNDRLAIVVRGTAVGLLLWPAAVELAPGHLEQLRSYTAMLEARLLTLALPPPAATTAAPSIAAASATRPSSAPTAGSAEEAFAQLLLEDLLLYLERERGAELRGARAQGNIALHFAPELERCRHAFALRYPASGQDALNAALGRLLE